MFCSVLRSKLTFSSALNPIRSFSYDGWYQKPQKVAIKPNTTAIVLGWAGSQQKHVQKYTEVYSQELGIGAHGYIMPMEVTFSYDQKLQRKLAQECLNQVLKENSGHNLIIHCFSNNGFGVYKHISQILKEKKELNLIGAILDSCPGPLSLFPYYIEFIDHDTPFFFPFLSIPGVYGYFQYTEAKKSFPVAILKGRVSHFSKNFYTLFHPDSNTV